MMLYRSSLQPSPRPGGIAALVAVCLAVLLGVLALVIDCGLLMAERRRAQATADAAALAAAAGLFFHQPTNNGTDPDNTALNSALAYAAANGYTNDGTTSVVQVKIPPASGPFTGLAGYAEVVVTSNSARHFSILFGAGLMPARARAVARGLWGPVGGAIIALDPDDKGAVNAHGNGNIVVTGGPVIVNSDHPQALIANGPNSLLSAPEFEITGSYASTGGGQIVGTINTGVDPMPDPLAELPPPNPASLPQGTMTVQNLGDGFKLYTLTPGVFAGGLSFSSKDSVIMQPGIYYMDAGGFSFSGQSGTYLTATGVMIYNRPTSNSQRIDISGQGSVSISPQATGPYAGISIFQDRNADVTIAITGNGRFDITGSVYAASAHAQIEGNGDVHIGSQYITRTLDVGGNGAVNINYDGTKGPKKRTYSLVE
jgi:hypothetical protein